MTIVTWEKYKKDNGIKPYANIVLSGLEEQGFVGLPLVMKSSLDDRKPKEIVMEAIAKQNFSLVIYQKNITPYQKGYSISVYAK